LRTSVTHRSYGGGDFNAIYRREDTTNLNPTTLSKTLEATVKSQGLSDVMLVKGTPTKTKTNHNGTKRRIDYFFMTHTNLIFSTKTSKQRSFSTDHKTLLMSTFTTPLSSSQPPLKLPPLCNRKFTLIQTKNFQEHLLKLLDQGKFSEELGGGGVLLT